MQSGSCRWSVCKVNIETEISIRIEPFLLQEPTWKSSERKTSYNESLYGIARVEEVLFGWMSCRHTSSRSRRNCCNQDKGEGISMVRGKGSIADEVGRGSYLLSWLTDSQRC